MGVININVDSSVFNEDYIPLIDTDYTYEIYYGGSGSGKSSFVAQKLLLNTLRRKYYRCIFTRKHSTDIRDSQFLLFKDMIREWKLQDFFEIKEGSMDIICINGNMLLSAGMNDPEKIKSVQKPTTIWCEETTELDFEDFEQLDLRLRGDVGTKLSMLMTFNPIHEDHWLKREFFEKQIKDCNILKTTYRDNKFIDQSAYEERLNRQSGNKMRVYKFGDWGTVRTGMEYYPEFDSGQHIGEPEYNPELPLHISLDFNVNPYMTLLVFQIKMEKDRAIVNQIDEFCLRHPFNKTKHVCDAFKKKYRDDLLHKAGLFFYGDATSQKKNTATPEEIEHDYSVLEQSLRTMLSRSSNRVPATNPPVLNRKDFVAAVLDGKTPIRLSIHTRCSETIADFNYLKEAPDGKKFKEVGKDSVTGASYQKRGHCTDAFEYFICEAFIKLFQSYVRK